MSKNISVSDEVYRKLRREKGDRSFSDVIDDHLEAGGTLADVTGQQIFAEGILEDVKEDIESLSEGTSERLTE